MAQKKDTSPSLFINFYGPDGKFEGKARPSRAV